MVTLFDLEDEQESVKHRAEKGFVKSKSLARSNGNRPPRNRLLTLQQSLSPASSSPARLSSAYTLPELTIFNQFYTLACGAPKQSSSKQHDLDLREVIRTRMLYLMPIYWEAYDPKAKAKDLPSYNMVWIEVKKAFEGRKMKDKKILYLGRLGEQVKVWEAFLGESREKLFDNNAPERKGLEEEFGKLVADYKKTYKKKEFLPPPVISFENKEVKSLEQFNQKNKTDDKFSANLFETVLGKMHPASLGYTYLEWYDDEELDPIIPDNVKDIYKAMAAIVSQSTLTAPKDKTTGKPEEYEGAFKTIIDALLGQNKRKKSSELITKQKIDGWSNKQKTAITKQLFEVQAGLGSLHHLLVTGQEVDIGQLKSLAVKLTSTKNISETGLNALALINASYDTFNGSVLNNISNVQTGVSNYVTDSAWANSFFAPAVITIGGTVHKIVTTNWSELNLTSAAGKIFTTSLGLARVGAQAAMFIKEGNKAWGIKPLMKSAEVSTNVAGVVTGGIGMVLNFHQIYKEIKEIAKLGGISRRFEGVVIRNEDLNEHLDVEFHKHVNRHRIENDDYEAFDVILQKMHHRKSYSFIGAVGAVAGVGAGATAVAIKVAAITAAVTLSNAWNPVGWVLVITSVVAGLGLLGWKGGKRVYKRMCLKRLRERIAKNNGYVPDFCKTTGDYWRYQAAVIIYFSSIAARDEENLKTYPPEALYRIAVGRAFAYILFADANPPGDIRENALDTAFELGVPGIMGFIKG
ncbi:MAG: hypothetical protein ACR2P1_14415 [Pseudomonadales bacterium]